MLLNAIGKHINKKCKTLKGPSGYQKINYVTTKTNHINQVYKALNGRSDNNAFTIFFLIPYFPNLKAQNIVKYTNTLLWS